MKTSTQHVIVGIVVCFVVYLSLGPVIVLLISSVNSSGNSLPFETSALDFSNYVDLLSNPRTYQFLANTAAFTVGTLLLSFGIAFLLAWFIERSDMPVRRLAYVLVLVPLAIPGMLSAISWVLLFGTTGLISAKLHGFFPEWEKPLNIYSMTGMIIVSGLKEVPIMFLMIAPALARMDPSLEEQSRVSGRTIFGSIWTITMHVVRPALLAAILIMAIMTLETLEVPFVIGPTAGIGVFSTYIFNLSQAPDGGLPNFGLASVASVLLLGGALVLLIGYRRLTKDTYMFKTVSGRGFRSERTELGQWRWAALGCIAIYALLTVFLPTLVLVWTSLMPFLELPSIGALSVLSTEAYTSLWSQDNVREATVNTLVVAGAAASATVVLTALTTWITTRPQSRLEVPIRVLTYLPLAIPGLVVGYGLLLIHLRWFTFLYGTIWIIAIGLVIKGMALGHRVLESAYANFDRQLEEASATCGASPRYTFWRVSLPLLTPAILSVWLLMFVFGMKELAIPAQLFASDNPVMSVIILGYWNHGHIQEASALGVVLVVILAVVTFIARTLIDRREAMYTSGGSV